MAVRFSKQMIPNLIQPFWAAWQGGEFLTDAAALAGTTRHRGLDAGVEELRSQANAMAIELMDRAKSAGALRPEVVGEDLLLLLIANTAVLTVTRQDAPAASKRVVALFLDAVRSAGPPTTLPHPPTSEEMYRAMTRMAAIRGCASSGADGTEGPATDRTTSGRNEGNA